MFSQDEVRRWIPSAGYRSPDHPKSPWIREQYLLDGVAIFFPEHIFGAHRRINLRDALARSDQHSDRDHEARIVAVR